METPLFTISDYKLPPVDKRRGIFLPFASEILAAYRKMPSHALPPLSPEKIDETIIDAAKAERVTFAHTANGEFAGFFAYTTHSVETNPALFQASTLADLPELSSLSTAEIDRIANVLAVVDEEGSLLEVCEMVVPIELRRHNLRVFPQII